MRKNLHKENVDHILALPETGLLRLPQVLKLVPVSKSTWWALVHDGKVPKPVKLSKRCSAWRVEDIKAILKEGISA